MEMILRVDAPYASHEEIWNVTLMILLLIQAAVLRSLFSYSLKEHTDEDCKCIIVLYSEQITFPSVCIILLTVE